MNNIITLDIQTNQKIEIKDIQAFKLHSLEIDNINDIESVQILSDNEIFWYIHLDMLLLISLIENNNRIIFPKDLLFKNDEYFYRSLIIYRSINIKIVSKKETNCKILLIDKMICKDEFIKYQNYIFDINDYLYISLINNKSITFDDSYMNRINKCYMKGNKINIIGNVDYDIIRKNIKYNNENMRVIKTVNKLNLISNIKSEILTYFDLYEYVYKIKTFQNPIKLDFDKKFNGYFLICLNNNLKISYGFIDKQLYHKIN